MVQRVVACTSATWETGSPARISPARTRPTSCSSTFEATSTSLRSSLMPSFPLADQADQHSRRFAALVIGTNAIVSGTPILGCSTCDRPHATSRKSSIVLRRIIGSMFMRVNSKCAHQVRPPLGPFGTDESSRLVDRAGAAGGSRKRSSASRLWRARRHRGRRRASCSLVTVPCPSTL